MTKAEQVIKYLMGKGAREVTSNSRKYRKFSYPGRGDKFYFVGKAGALRVGRTVGESVSVSHIYEPVIKKIFEIREAINS